MPGAKPKPYGQIWTHVKESDLAQIVPGTPLYDRVRRALKEQRSETWNKYLVAAQKQQRDGELEIDDDALVSVSDDPGAYVLAWVWGSDSDAGVRRRKSKIPQPQKC